MGCSERASALLAFDPRTATAWLRDLIDAHPSLGLALCDTHAERTSVPMGWSRIDERRPAWRNYDSEQPFDVGDGLNYGRSDQLDLPSDAVPHTNRPDEVDGLDYARETDLVSGDQARRSLPLIDLDEENTDALDFVAEPVPDFSAGKFEEPNPVPGVARREVSTSSGIEITWFDNDASTPQHREAPPAAERAKAPTDPGRSDRDDAVEPVGAEADAAAGADEDEWHLDDGDVSFEDIFPPKVNAPTDATPPRQPRVDHHPDRAPGRSTTAHHDDPATADGAGHQPSLFSHRPGDTPSEVADHSRTPTTLPRVEARPSYLPTRQGASDLLRVDPGSSLLGRAFGFAPRDPS